MLKRRPIYPSGHRKYCLHHSIKTYLQQNCTHLSTQNLFSFITIFFWNSWARLCPSTLDYFYTRYHQLHHKRAILSLIHNSTQLQGGSPQSASCYTSFVYSSLSASKCTSWNTAMNRHKLSALLKWSKICKFRGQWEIQWLFTEMRLKTIINKNLRQ